jgi:hypothetical protein
VQYASRRSIASQIASRVFSRAQTPPRPPGANS